MRRNRFAPSPTYGKPHPGITYAKADAVFIQSIFDAEPPHVRKRVHEKDAQPLFDWFYGLSRDPRPANNRPQLVLVTNFLPSRGRTCTTHSWHYSGRLTATGRPCYVNRPTAGGIYDNRTEEYSDEGSPASDFRA